MIKLIISVLMIFLLSSCDFFRGYSPKDLPKEYSISFSETCKIKQVVDDPQFNGGDYWQTPKETIALGTGDCEDLAHLLEYKLKQKGLPVEIKFGKTYIKNEENHAWCEAINEKGERIVMDPFFGWWKKNPKSEYYVVFDQLPLAIIIKQIDYSIRISEGN